MTRKKTVKLELMNPRYTRAELRDHAAEFIPYARYAGYMLHDFNAHLNASRLHPVKPEIAERIHRLSIETTMENANILSQIIRIYPSFGTWKLKLIAASLSASPSIKSRAKPKTKKTTGKKAASRTSGGSKKKKSKKVLKKKTAKAKTKTKMKRPVKKKPVTKKPVKSVKRVVKKKTTVKKSPKLKKIAGKKVKNR
ncbi:MAG: hypothetical protein IEMM0002_0528 [bacterium]|nr:MAG: hypothetical protein IEMM0002_0528 [bacterium]